MMIDIENPATNEYISSVAAFSKSDVDEAAAKAEAAASAWEKTAASKKAVLLINAAAKIRERQDALAALLTREQGKPLAEAKNEIQGAAHVFEYYASVCGSINGDAKHLPGYGYMNVVRRPVGLCAAIIPWNMPAIIFAWKVGAALACGNTVLVKPSITASLTILAMAGMMYEAGVSRDVLQMVTGTGKETGHYLIEHPAVRHISFTGSVATGKTVAETAARRLKRTTLELGGNDAFVVTASADLKKAAAAAVRHRFYNCGQVCTSPKRILVHESLEDEFISLASGRIANLKVGDGLLGSTMGPVHTKAGRDAVEQAVAGILDAGGNLVCGGEHIGTAGYFYAPTLIRDVDPASVSEEIFGPVMPVISFSDEEEALEIANGTRYGLGASVWTENLKTAHRYADELKAGVVWVNKHLILPPELSFGGVKESGFGRENGMDFIAEYTESKSILVG